MLYPCFETHRAETWMVETMGLSKEFRGLQALMNGRKDGRERLQLPICGSLCRCYHVVTGICIYYLVVWSVI